MSETWNEAVDGAFSDIANDIAEAFNSAMHDLWHGSGSSGSSGSSNSQGSGGGTFCNVPAHQR